MRSSRTSIKSIRATKVTLLMRTLFIWLVVLALSLATIPSSAADADADAKQAMADWKAAVAAVGAAKKAAKEAAEKKGIAMTNFKSGGITAAEQKILDNLLAEEAAANAALEAAIERLFAARAALENALQALADDSALRKELRRQRDGLILDDPNARGESTRTKKTGSQMQQIGQLQTSGGLHVTTFNLENGRVIVRLPDDMRAGDTISGTVVSEPKGNTEEERNANRGVLKGYVVVIADQRYPVDKGTVGPWVIPQPQSPSGPGVPPTLDSFFDIFVAVDLSTSPLGPVRIPLQPTHPSGAIITPDPKITQPTHPSGAIITPDPKITNPPFTFPPIGQTGRNIVVPGPFDGNGVNTELMVSDGEDRNTMGRSNVIAESPRKAVFVMPSNVVGPVTLHLTEGNTRATGSHRSVAVNLSAPKTDLLKGEKTTLTVQVSGLAGIKQPVPLTLTHRGVIIMEGGPYQPLLIQPSQVGADGRYTTTRGITGVQAGGWTATATVVTGPFNVCLQDDSRAATVILWNTVSGDYSFRPPGGTSAPPTGGAPLTGKGKMVMKGCIITLTHNAPDRRVFARLDACTNSGDAKVETTSPKTNVTITDRNISDNTVPPE